MFERILVPADLTDGSRHALDLALALVAPRNGRVFLLHVVERIPNLGDRELRTFYDQLERHARKRLHELVATAHSAGGVEVVEDVVFGRRAEEIVKAAEDRDCDLVVLHHAQDSGPLLGSISYKVGVLAPCSVLLLK
jgi:nucleotide-binding universal stress UspA family protein